MPCRRSSARKHNALRATGGGSSKFSTSLTLGMAEDLNRDAKTLYSCNRTSTNLAMEAQGETTSCSRWIGRAWRRLRHCRAKSGQPLGRTSLEEPLDLLQPLERPCRERITEAN